MLEKRRPSPDLFRSKRGVMQQAMDCHLRGSDLFWREPSGRPHHRHPNAADDLVILFWRN
jgi:hypothetical protein